MGGLGKANMNGGRYREGQSDFCGENNFEVLSYIINMSYIIEGYEEIVEDGEAKIVPITVDLSEEDEKLSYLWNDEFRCDMCGQVHKFSETKDGLNCNKCVVECPNL